MSLKNIFKVRDALVLNASKLRRTVSKSGFRLNASVVALVGNMSGVSKNPNGFSLETSEDHITDLSHVDVAFSALAVGYGLVLDSYKEKIYSLAESDGISRGNANEFVKESRGGVIPYDLAQAIEKIEAKGDIKNINKFLTDYDSWNGGKTIDRGDFSYSPILSTLGLTAANSGGVAAFSIVLRNYPEIVEAIVNDTTARLVVPLHEGGASIFLLRDIIVDSEFKDRLLISIITKPFTILTGASGTGKTKLAESLADYLRNHEERSEATNVAIVPVGADWTDNRNVLGFVNHLRDAGDDKRPIYQSTPVLDLLLNAVTNPDMPHFLILDEMNLSHVERYFSDFLSVMEQRDGELLLHDEGSVGADDFCLPRYSGDVKGVPTKLSYPKNLFIIGTVNIDETTYMFSPKVLDRANVIEFKVGHDEIDKFLTSPAPYPEIEKADEGVAEAFLTLVKEAQGGDWGGLPDEVQRSIKDHLLVFFDIMQRGRFEFAYRTSNEVMRYLRVCRHLAEKKDEWDTDGWKCDLDDQVLQKILPKLHGSIGRIGALLADLAEYCHAGKQQETKPKSSTGSRLNNAGELKSDEAAFPKSLVKLQSMIVTLQDEQFVSFIQ